MAGAPHARARSARHFDLDGGSGAGAPAPAMGRAVSATEVQWDVGTSRVKYLSYAAAMDFVNRNHPRRPVRFNLDGRVLEWGWYDTCGTDTGKLPWCGSDGTESKFERFGMGIVLFFKQLKFLACMLFFVTLLVVPNLLLFYSGGAFNDQFVAGTGSTEQLVLFTVGNLGEGAVVCGDAYEGETLTMSCPAGTVIGKVEAYYGEPEGVCECPVAQTPDPNCFGTVDGDSCEPQRGGDERTGYCHLEEQRVVTLSQSGFSYEAGPCCSDRLENGKPDFDELNIKASETCNSFSATTVATGLCIGERECTVLVSRNHENVWNARPSMGIKCPDRDLDDPRVNASMQATDDDTTTDDDSSECHYYIDEGDYEEMNEQCGDVESRRLVAVAQCFKLSLTPFFTNEKWSKQDIAVYIAIFDTAAMLVFLVSVCTLASISHKEEKITKASPARRFTARDYTVAVTGLPYDLSITDLEKSLRKHFEELLTEEDWIWVPNGELAAGCVKVADINFAVDNGSMLDLYIRRGSLLQKLDRLLKLETLRKREDADERTMKRIADRVQQAKDNIKEHDKKIDQEFNESWDADRGALVAYVTFEEEEGRERALHAYPDSALYWCCQSRMYQLSYTEQGRTKRSRLTVREAPEPSDINWENIPYSSCNRCIRSALTSVIVLVLLFLAALLIFVVEDRKREMERQFPSIDCDVLSEPPTELEKQAVVRDEFADLFPNMTSGKLGRLECYCKDFIINSGSPQDVFDVTFPVPKDDVLDRVDLNVTQFCLDEAGGDDDEALAQCSEFATWTDYVAEGYDVTQEKLCTGWIESFATRNSLIYGAALITLAVNYVLRFFLTALVNFEKAHSRTAALLSRAGKFLLAQFINTAGLVLLINATVDTDFVLLRSGEFKDFSARWYRTVGTSIQLTMILNIVVPHFTPLSSCMFACFNRCWDRSCTCDESLTKALTQRELDNTLMGPPMAYDERMAQVWVILFVCLTYGGGMPLLLAVAFVAVGLFFWAEKFFFVNVYRSPPNFGSELSRSFIALLPFAGILHLAFSTWMFTNDSIFPPDNILAEAGSFSNSVGSTVTDGTKQVPLSEYATLDSSELAVTARTSEPHVVILVILIALTILYLFLKNVLLLSIGKAIRFICPCCFAPGIPEDDTEAADEHRRHKLPNYFDAIPTEVLRDVDMNLRVVKRNLRDAYGAAYERRQEALRVRGERKQQYEQMLAEMDAKRRELMERQDIARVAMEDDANIAAEVEHLRVEGERLRQQRQAAAAMARAKRAAEANRRRLAAARARRQKKGKNADDEGKGEGGKSEEDEEDVAAEDDVVVEEGEGDGAGEEEPDLRPKYERRVPVSGEEAAEAAAILEAEVEDLAQRLYMLEQQVRADEGARTELVAAEVRTLSGRVPSYDLHDNLEYASRLGLDTMVPPEFKRRLKGVDAKSKTKASMGAPDYAAPISFNVNPVSQSGMSMAHMGPAALGYDPSLLLDDGVVLPPEGTGGRGAADPDVA